MCGVSWILDLVNTNGNNNKLDSQSIHFRFYS